MTEAEKLYPAYKANIHERRAVAYVTRAVPLACLLVVCVGSLVGIWRYPLVLLILCACLNTLLWIYLVSTGIFAVLGARRAAASIAKADQDEPAETETKTEGKTETGGLMDVESLSHVQHLIVLPNYAEDEEMLGQSLQSLAQADGSKEFRVVLAMEEKEKDGEEKGKRLVAKWSSSFKKLSVTKHPKNLVEVHMDGTEDAEIAGKASNLKYAVFAAYDEVKKEPDFDLDSMVLTVADADCLFHPGYFKHVASDFSSDMNYHRMWQAPQLPYRNLYASPLPSRAWGYLASMDEFGGVSALQNGGVHMVFSGYSLTMKLAVEAAPWDGDGIAEDHHAFLRCFFYSCYKNAQQSLENSEKRALPTLEVRPVFLPVKSTSVMCDDYWQSWVERWHQAKRHMQGVSELSYALMASWDFLSSLPLRKHSLRLYIAMFRAVVRPFVLHLLPTIQGIALGVLTLYWITHHRRVPRCAESMYLTVTNKELAVCGLAGAWSQVWPVLIPLAFVISANYLYVVVVFMRPHEEKDKTKRKDSIWHSENSGFPPLRGSERLRAFSMIFFDVVVCLVAICVPYALIPELIAYWNTCVRGNRIKYVTAAKGLGNAAEPAYGATEKKTVESKA